LYNPRAKSIILIRTGEAALMTSKNL